MSKFPTTQATDCATPGGTAFAPGDTCAGVAPTQRVWMKLTCATAPGGSGVGAKGCDANTPIYFGKESNPTTYSNAIVSNIIDTSGAVDTSYVSIRGVPGDAASISCCAAAPAKGAAWVSAWSTTGP